MSDNQHLLCDFFLMICNFVLPFFWRVSRNLPPSNVHRKVNNALRAKRVSLYSKLHEKRTISFFRWYDKYGDGLRESCGKRETRQRKNYFNLAELLSVLEALKRLILFLQYTVCNASKLLCENFLYNMSQLQRDTEYPANGIKDH